MPSLRALRGLVRLVDDPDPRLLQTTFAALVLLESLLRASIGTPLDQATWPLLGLGLLALTTIAVWVVPRAGLVVPRAAVVVVVLDLASIGLVRLVPEGSAAAILVVLPGLWLARLHGARGAAVAGVAAAWLVSVPGLLYSGSSGATLTRALLPPVVAWLAGLGVASAVARAESERRISAAILDTVDVGLVLLDAEGRYLRANDGTRTSSTSPSPQAMPDRPGSWGRSTTPTAGSWPARRCRACAPPVARSTTTSASGAATTR